MRAVFFETELFEEKLFHNALSAHEVAFIAEPLTEANAELAAKADVVSVFVYSKVNTDVLSQLSNVKLITTRSMGFDHIDVRACAAADIAVCNVPTYGEHAVAEHAFALLLGLARHLVEGEARVRGGSFDYHGLRGVELNGKTLGLIGGGKIGMRVARLGKAFGMEVLVYDPMPNLALQKEIGFAYVELAKLMERSHVISVHAPYNTHTHHLLNSETFKMAKRKPILINTARGGIVDTEALLDALDKGVVVAAGLDVIEGESDIREEREVLTSRLQAKCDIATLARNHILFNRPNVLITPHIAFNTEEAVASIRQTTIDNIISFAAGQPVNNVKP